MAAVWVTSAGLRGLQAVGLSSCTYWYILNIDIFPSYPHVVQVSSKLVYSFLRHWPQWNIDYSMVSMFLIAYILIFCFYCGYLYFCCPFCRRKFRHEKAGRTQKKIIKSVKADFQLVASLSEYWHCEWWLTVTYHFTEKTKIGFSFTQRLNDSKPLTK